jgi:hypothetical protein
MKRRSFFTTLLAPLFAPAVPPLLNTINEGINNAVTFTPRYFTMSVDASFCEDVRVLNVGDLSVLAQIERDMRQTQLNFATIAGGRS